MCFGGRYGELSRDMTKFLKKIAEAQVDRNDSWKKMPVASREEGFSQVYQRLVNQVSDTLDFALTDCIKKRVMDGLNHNGHRLDDESSPDSSDVQNWEEQLELLADQEWREVQRRL